MAKLIDAEELKKKITDETAMKEWGKVLVNTVIEHQPAVDAVEVVRCKDCEYGEKCSHPNRIHCELTGRKNHVLDFCSHGERRG